MTLRIRTKLLIAFAVILLPTLILLAIVYRNQEVMHKAFHKVEDASDEANMMMGLMNSMHFALDSVNDYVAGADRKKLDEFEKFSKDAEGLRRDIERLLSHVEMAHGDPMIECRAALKGLDTGWLEVKALSLKVFAITDPVGNAKAARLRKEAEEKWVSAVLKEFANWHEITRKELKETTEVAGKAWQMSRLFMLGGFFILLALGISFSIGYSGYFTRPIKAIQNAADAFAGGTFDTRVVVETRDEIGELAGAFNNMAAELQKTTISRDELVKEMEDRKRAEEALRESGETLKAILNATTDALFLIDAEGKILILNETTALRLGKTKDELTGACIYDHLPPDKARSRRAYVIEAVSSGKIVHFEDERNGEWIDHSIYPLSDEQGKITRIAIYGRYITERKLAEEKLKKAYQELKTAQRATLNIMEDIAFKRKELEALYLTSRISGSTMDLHKLLDEILQTILGLDLFGVERKGGVFVMEGDRMKLVSHIGFQDSLIELHKDMRTGDCLCGLAAETGEVVISKDSNKDDRHTISYEGMTSHGHIVVPLKAANKLNGVLCLYVPAGIELDQGKINLLEAIGNQTGIALENMRLYKESVEKTEYLERFNRLMVGRELEMLNLKAEVNELLEKDGQPKKYEAPEKAAEL